MKDLEKALASNKIEHRQKVYTSIYDEILNEIDIAKRKLKCFIVTIYGLFLVKKIVIMAV